MGCVSSRARLKVAAARLILYRLAVLRCVCHCGTALAEARLAVALACSLCVSCMCVRVFDVCVVPYSQKLR
eukprot:scaffold59106_cov73-Phaeocystis_antarctica.AAC.2